MHLPRAIVRPAVVLFCIWHMAAVAVYAVPDPAVDPVASWIRTHLQPLVRPYMLATSQWQQWNLFSPEPRRRITEYDVVDGEDRLLLTLRPDTYRWWRKTDEIAMFSKWEEQEASVTQRMLQRYLAAYCAPLHVPAGGQLTVRGRYMDLPVLPPNDIHARPSPLWQPSGAVTVTCDPASSITPVFRP